MWVPYLHRSFQEAVLPSCNRCVIYHLIYFCAGVLLAPLSSKASELETPSWKKSNACVGKVEEKSSFVWVPYLHHKVFKRVSYLLAIGA